MTFQNEHSYDLNDPALQYFKTNTQLDRERNNLNIIYSFLSDMKFNINYGNKKSIRYYFFKELFYQYYQQIGRGLGSDLRSCAGFLPSDPDELVDQ